MKTAGLTPLGVRVPHPPLSLWRGGRAAEGNGLLNRHSSYRAIEGSNPSLSAQHKKPANRGLLCFPQFSRHLPSQLPTANCHQSSLGPQPSALVPRPSALSTQHSALLCKNPSKKRNYFERKYFFPIHSVIAWPERHTVIVQSACQQSSNDLYYTLTSPSH